LALLPFALCFRLLAAPASVTVVFAIQQQRWEREFWSRKGGKKRGFAIPLPRVSNPELQSPYVFNGKV